MLNQFTKFLSVTSCLILASLMTTINLQANNDSFGGTFSTLTILQVNESEVTFNGINGGGSGRVVFVKANANIGETAPAVDNTTYAADQIFGSGMQIGTSGWYCVFNGNFDASNITVTGLKSNTPYTFHVVEYDGQPSQELYNVANGNVNLVSVKTLNDVVLPYTFSASTATFTEISGGTAITDILDDDITSSSPTPIGFPFLFAGNVYTEITATSNGYIDLNPYFINQGNGGDNNNRLDFSIARPVIAPLWDDVSGAGGTSSYITTGTAPNRIFTIEFLNWRWNYTGAAAISYQIKLYEVDNRIEFIYRRESGDLVNPSTSIGLAFPSAGPGHFISLNNVTGSATASSTVETIDISTKPETGQVFSFTPVKMDQTVNFVSISNKILGDAAFSLAATSDSKLPVTYSTTSDKITIEGNVIKLVKAGSVTIKAVQSGNGFYNAAPSVTNTFCINPAKPTFTVAALNSGIPVFSSSSTSGNQWFKDGAAIGGATDSTFTVSTSGTYTLTVSADNCSSVSSDEKTFVIAGVEVLNNDVLVYPTPAGDHVIVDVTRLQSTTPVSLVIYDVTGRVVHTRTDNGKMIIPTDAYLSGIYIMKLQSSKQTIIKKLVKS